MPTKGICLIWSRGRLFSLCLVGDKVSESSTEPSPAGISEPRAEISWCIVIVQRSGKVSRGTAVGCIFLSFSTILILGLTNRRRHRRERSVSSMSLIKLSTGIVYYSWPLSQFLENITSINTFTRRGDCNPLVSKIKGLFHRKFLRESGEIYGKMSGKH